MAFESSRLYRLIRHATPDSLLAAMSEIDQMSDEDIRGRSEKDKSSYYHVIVSRASLVQENCESMTPLFPLIYKLALRNINVNAQNIHGNTCLHLACLKPHTEALCKHFIRVGADPCIPNKKNCRVIHHCRGHVCYLVKGQNSAKSGLWNAVEKEDIVLTERLLRSWCRVNIRKNKTLADVADETGNLHIAKMLTRYEKTNEMAICAFAGEADKVRELIKAGADLKQMDESCEPPMPLLVAVAEFGDVTKGVQQVLADAGQDKAVYDEVLQNRMNEFESSEFYRMVENAEEESLNKALELVATLDVTLTSYRSERNGWTYLHYIVDTYNRFMSEGKVDLARILIRIIYKLALRGIDVNRRDAQGVTALIKASEKLDQAIMTHILRIGGDPQITSNGKTVNEEVYEDKGKLVFDRKYRQADLPGLWVAIANNDICKAERWLKSWSRVNARNGDRRMIEVARDLRRPEIVKLLEAYEHINEFVCATMACDLKAMMHLLALGKGQYKVNTIDDFFHVGYTWDRHAEFMPRPIIIAAMEICTPEVVDFLLNFGADLSKEYEESFPCGPIAFWAFRDHIDNRNTLVVAKHADVGLQDELGCTMLHKAVQKKQPQNQADIIQILLDRGINIAARDTEGSTARDYIVIYGIEDPCALQQIIDNHVLDLVNNDSFYDIENLIIESYNHITDIRGTRKNKNAKEIAELKEYKEIIALMEEYEQYKQQISLLHESARTGDLLTISKLSGEKRCAWSKDMAGRTLLHNAVLHEHADIVKFLVEQHPNLINATDNLLRTPLHYCVCLEERQEIWPILQDGGADPNLMEVNNMSVYDYVRELEMPTSMKDRSRGRRDRNYRPDALIQVERNMDYGGRAARHELAAQLRDVIKTGGLSDVKALTAGFSGKLAGDDLDAELLKICVDEKREEVAKHLIANCGARHNAVLKMTKEDSTKTMTLSECAKRAGLNDLLANIEQREQELVAQQEQQAVEQEQQAVEQEQQAVEQEQQAMKQEQQAVEQEQQAVEQEQQAMEQEQQAVEQEQQAAEE